MSAYQPTEWKDGQSGGTPINATSLNKIETGLVEALNNRVAVKAVANTGQAVTVSGQPTLYVVANSSDGTFDLIYDDGVAAKEHDNG